MTIAQLEVFLKENPSWEVTFLTMRVGDPVHLGVKKCPSDFLKYVVEPIQRRNKSDKEVRYHAPREI